MAEINIQTKINTAEASKGLKDLRKSLKDLVSAQSEVGAGTKEFKNLQDAINKTENKLGDLNDSFGTLRGSGVERLSGSLSLLREGFTSADPGKLSIAMQGLGAAMKAIHIFLLIEGAKLLFENFDKLVSIFSSSERSARANEKALQDLTTSIDLQSGSIQRNIIERENELTSLKRNGGGLQDIINKIKEINSLKNDQFVGELQKVDKEIKNIQEKLKASSTSTKKGLLQLFGFNAGEDEGMKELEGQLTKLKIKQKELANSSTKSVIDTNNEVADLNKAAADKAAEEKKKRIEDDYQQAIKNQDAIDKQFTDRLAKETQEYEDALASQNAADEAARKQSEANLEARINTEIAIEARGVSERIQLDKQAFAQREADAKEELANKIKREKQAYDATAAGIASVQALSDIAFLIKSKKSKGDAAEQLKLAKQQFNINKGLQIANATMMGVQATLAAFASGVATPILGPATGALFATGAALVAAASIAKIASQEFQGGATDTTTDDFSTPNVSAPPPASIETPSISKSFNPNAVETQNNNRVWVSEFDITKTQNKVKVLESRATFP